MKSQWQVWLTCSRPLKYLLGSELSQIPSQSPMTKYLLVSSFPWNWSASKIPNLGYKSEMRTSDWNILTNLGGNLLNRRQCKYELHPLSLWSTESQCLIFNMFKFLKPLSWRSSLWCHDDMPRSRCFGTSPTNLCSKNECCVNNPSKKLFCHRPRPIYN